MAGRENKRILKQLSALRFSFMLFASVDSTTPYTSTSRLFSPNNQTVEAILCLFETHVTQKRVGFTSEWGAGDSPQREERVVNGSLPCRGCKSDTLKDTLLESGCIADEAPCRYFISGRQSCIMVCNTRLVCVSCVCFGVCVFVCV